MKNKEKIIYLIKMAKDFGISVYETRVALIILGGNGVKGAKAGVALGKALSKLKK